MLEGEVEPRSDAAEHDVRNPVEGLLARDGELDLVSGHDVLSTNGRRALKVSTGSGRTIVPQPVPFETNVKKEPLRKTALQVINELVKARLTQKEVDILDDNGVRGQGTVESKEFKLLQERGLEVQNVSIGGLRLDPEIEETIIRRWSSTWLLNARQESEQVERKRSIVETNAHEKAIRQYADFLSKDLIQKKPVGVKETLKTLLLRTRTLIMNSHQLRQRMTDEQQDLEDIIRWLEGNGA